MSSAGHQTYDANLAASIPTPTRQQMQGGYNPDILAEKATPSASTPSRHDSDQAPTPHKSARKVPFFRTTKGAIILVVVVIVVIAAIIGGAVAGSKKKKNTSATNGQTQASAAIAPASSTPTSTPTPTPTPTANVSSDVTKSAVNPTDSFGFGLTIPLSPSGVPG